MAVITTSRLVLRRWQEGDVAAMAAFNADPEVMRWIGDGSVRTLQQTKASIEAWEQQWQRHGFGLFALELRATGELAGAARRRAVAGWAGVAAAARPDFASVNVSEPGMAALLEALEAAGVAAEAGVWSAADARTAASASPAGGWLRILVEVIDVPAAGAVAAADEILRELDRSGVAVPRLLHGEQEACWPLVRHAGRLGLPTRVGLEDTTTGPDGQQVSGNAELVSVALAEWTAAGPERRAPDGGLGRAPPGEG